MRTLKYKEDHTVFCEVIFYLLNLITLKVNVFGNRNFFLALALTYIFEWYICLNINHALCIPIFIQKLARSHSK